MSAEKFTPGPWLAELVGTTGSRDNPEDVYEITNGYTRIAENVHARDANLIAAAPDLYAALEALLIMSDSGPQPRKFDEALSWRANDERARAMAIAALARARGEP